MARLIYSMIQSLDGYVADVAGRFDWAEPDEQVHSFANELQRTRCLPSGVRLDLQLVDQRRFDNGTVYVSYRPVG